MDPALPPGGRPRHGQATARPPGQISGPQRSPAEPPQGRAGEEPLRAAVPTAESASSRPATSNATSPRPSRNDLPPREPGNSRQDPSPVPSLTPHQRPATEPQSSSALIDRHFSIYLLPGIHKRKYPRPGRWCMKWPPRNLFPVGVVVSICWRRTTRPAPRSARSASASRCLSDRHGAGQADARPPDHRADGHGTACLACTNAERPRPPWVSNRIRAGPVSPGTPGCGPARDRRPGGGE